MTGEAHIVDRLNDIKPKERVAYWTGFLARDRVPLTQNGSALGHRAEEIGNIAHSHYLAGRVDLVQRKLGDGLYDYVAIGRSPPYEPRYAVETRLKPAKPGRSP